MTIVALTRPPVKPVRNTPRSPAPFGQGILASRPTHRLDCTLADAAWAAQFFGEISDRHDDALDRHYDVLAVEAAALDRHERGLCC
jgi:hypothetical protein